MNKDNRNNLKLMKLYELLMTESDENHPMTTRTLCERLARIGISATYPRVFPVMNRDLGRL